MEGRDAACGIRAAGRVLNERPRQRNKKLAALHRSYPNYSHPFYQPPCHLCGDPAAKVQPHSEDYAEDFRLERPAMYAVCFHCHRRLHGRFDAGVVRLHRSLRCRPAMAAGIANKRWEVSDIVALLEAAESKKAAQLSRGWI
jgi:hypothetical protein